MMRVAAPDVKFKYKFDSRFLGIVGSLYEHTASTADVCRCSDSGSTRYSGRRWVVRQGYAPDLQ